MMEAEGAKKQGRETEEKSEGVKERTRKVND